MHPQDCDRQPIRLNGYVVIDITTTGDEPNWYFIVRICALKCMPGLRPVYFSALAKPPIAPFKGKYIPASVTHRTGIMHEDLARAPCLYHTLNQFDAFASGLPLVTHNYSHDLGFLCHDYAHFMPRSLSNWYVDSGMMADMLYPELSDTSVRALARIYRIKSTKEERNTPCLLHHRVFMKLLDEWNIPYQESMWRQEGKVTYQI